MPTASFLLGCLTPAGSRRKDVLHQSKPEPLCSTSQLAALPSSPQFPDSFNVCVEQWFLQTLPPLWAAKTVATYFVSSAPSLCWQGSGPEPSVCVPHLRQSWSVPTCPGGCSAMLCSGWIIQGMALQQLCCLLALS